MVFHITLSVMHIANYKLGLAYSSSAYPWSIFSTWYSFSGSKWLKMHFLFFFGTFSFSGNIPSICRLGKNVWNNVQTFWKYCWLCTTRLRIFYRIRILKYKPGGYKNWRNACEISVLWDMGEMFRWRISKSYTLLKYFFHKMQNLE